MYVELKGVNKKYGDYPASHDINFGVKKGQLVALLGPSGSGKTTILRMIAGLESADSGDILINGKRINDLTASKREIGFVFQNYALFRYMTVFENIAFGLSVKKYSKNEIKARVAELIELTGLSGLEKRYPSQLSGGQKQRVAFARALAPKPHVLLLDEPFAAVDAKIRKELRTWLKAVIQKIGITSIFVTHDHEEAIEVADEIIVTNKGRVVQQATPLIIYQQPKTPFVAQFIGESDVINNINRLKGFESVTEDAKAVVRPEFIQLFKRDELVQYEASVELGIVESVKFRGSFLEISVAVKGIHLVTNRSLEKAIFECGETVQVFIYRLYVFNETEASVIENPNTRLSILGSGL
ncbi:MULTISPECIES: ABC transporter ATP-binding protein [unclassified Enterococcus]|uniref:ABC transporter ATP-binding protein n=1 Tax=unclassified Enterococcus TaxID=2608891 RepID=UPI0015569D27|nr:MULTISPECIES: ABC transporter ATP-binding protein [unclassified Enterococcus]MBS7576399.1 ABC transporter ATP-binding protein [Enterococcus sp. MMGLQ5-2]MBS7583631.1 ABC transporter ATP-binding protein [Enterococcus sp. MMGLQ5-1]NPD11492.1 ABC transporter ATP-binding protein [Enterococcus sp. MMGLQ5-1]NPD36236.1 ABC transporter ATP-binding protein [Enterococcus sp. MMGLQ5-2]